MTKKIKIDKDNAITEKEKSEVIFEILNRLIFFKPEMMTDEQLKEIILILKFAKHKADDELFRRHSSS